MDESAVIEAIRALLKPWYVEGEELVDAYGALETIGDLVFKEDA